MAQGQGTKIKKKAATIPPGTWIEATFYDDTKIKDNRPLSRTDLDKATITIRRSAGIFRVKGQKAELKGRPHQDEPAVGVEAAETQHGPADRQVGRVAGQGRQGRADRHHDPEPPRWARPRSPRNARDQGRSHQQRHHQPDRPP